jgi:menaquinol-cytochrome c reductase iron-sulfur subunit
MNEKNRTGEPLVAATSRRTLLSAVSLGAGAIAAAVVAVPVVGFVLGPLLGKRPVVWRNVGSIANYPVGQTTAVRFEAASELSWAGVSARMAAWLRHEPEGRLIAFSVNCTHLGCPVRWEPEANLFMCPCHGGVYYSDGKVAGGPPPRPLPRYPVRLRNGQVEIRAEPFPIA